MVAYALAGMVPCLGAGDVHIWRLPLDFRLLSEDLAILSPEEMNRADRFLVKGARDRYCVAHAGLRRVLAAYLDLDPWALRFISIGEGKPLLADHPDLSFNLSHSEDLALVAAGWSRPMGVDVERMRTVPDAMRIARRYFTPEECDGILATADAARSRPFLQCWTRKEAVIKAAGLGIITALNQLAVPFGPASGARVEHAGLWDLYDIDVGPDYIAALAISLGPVKLVSGLFHDPRAASPV